MQLKTQILIATSREGVNKYTAVSLARLHQDLERDTETKVLATLDQQKQSSGIFHCQTST